MLATALSEITVLTVVVHDVEYPTDRGLGFSKRVNQSFHQTATLFFGQ